LNSSLTETDFLGRLIQLGVGLTVRLISKRNCADVLLHNLPLIDFLVDASLKTNRQTFSCTFSSAINNPTHSGEQAVDVNFALLTISPDSRQRLLVVCWIPIRFKKNQTIGADQI